MWRVLSVSYPLAQVGPDAAGGAEQVLSQIDRALVAGGHRSIVIAPEGSVVAGELVSSPLPKGELTKAARAETILSYRRTISAVIAREAVDLVHLHGVDWYEYFPPAPARVLVTLHLPPAWYPAHVFENPPPNVWLHCVSLTQAGACPPCPRLLPPIENGVDTLALRDRGQTRTYALALGRICPEKGYHLALEAAVRARSRFILAGQVFGYPEHEEYFRNEIQPRLDEERVFVGAAGLERKGELLSGARCLLVPSLVPETSSLVTMEALACGTPVVAFPAGALAELIEDGRTGFLVRDVEEMSRAISACAALDPKVCRDTAVRRHSAEAMIEGYLAVYRRLLGENKDERTRARATVEG